ncbi:MAG TPA: hypothetical protein VN174_01270 [Candidatus Methanoperedens sp.]|nr:hypothetical protein [Candidatus Methanoperedens sp.]
MIESVLKLHSEIPWFPGTKQDYGIVSGGGEMVGRLSITRFSIEDPYEMNWIYVNNIEIPELSNRDHGYAYKAMLEVNKQIELEGANGVLKNSIMERRKKDFYEKLGWKKQNGVSGVWEFFLTRPVSVFVVRNVVENVVKRNFVR